MPVFVADEQDAAPVDVANLRRLADAVLTDQNVPVAMEVSVLCVDRATITALNAQHMGHEGPTDVLAFPVDLPGESAAGEPAILGDVVLCPEVAAEQARERGEDPDRELELLVVHGILHLLGHDHAGEEERTTMFALTDRLLASYRQQAAP
jgi:probable rRNA maturation factor